MCMHKKIRQVFPAPREDSLIADTTFTLHPAQLRGREVCGDKGEGPADKIRSQNSCKKDVCVGYRAFQMGEDTKYQNPEVFHVYSISMAW